MALVTATLGRVIMVRWPVEPADADVAQFDALVADAKTRLGKPLYHVTFIVEGTQLPPPPLQKALIRRAIKMQSTCEANHAVLEGKGVLQAIGRRFLKTMVKMVGLKGAHVNATAEEAVKALPGADVIGIEHDALLKQAREAGVVVG